MYLVINKCVTDVKVSNFSGHYLRNRSTLDIGVLGYIGIVQHKEHSPEVLSIPPGTPCMYRHLEGLHWLDLGQHWPRFKALVFRNVLDTHQLAWRKYSRRYETSECISITVTARLVLFKKLVMSYTWFMWSDFVLHLVASSWHFISTIKRCVWYMKRKG